MAHVPPRCCLLAACTLLLPLCCSSFTAAPLLPVRCRHLAALPSLLSLGCSGPWLLQGEIFFVPQRPYVVLGTLRDQLLYPTWAHPEAGDTLFDGPGSESSSSSSRGGGGGGSSGDTPGTAPGTDSGTAHVMGAADGNGSGSGSGHSLQATNGSSGSSSGVAARPLPSDLELRAALRVVQLGPLLDRIGGNLDAVADWASILSLGEQQRLAFARWGPHGGEVKRMVAACGNEAVCTRPHMSLKLGMNSCLALLRCTATSQPRFWQAQCQPATTYCMRF